MENLSAFKILGLKEEFDIPDLEIKYYQALRKNLNKEEINAAYLALKNEIIRARILCMLNAESEFDKTIPMQIFNILQKNDSEKKQIWLQLKEEIIFLAKNNDWKKCWYKLQVLNYIK